MRKSYGIAAWLMLAGFVTLGQAQEITPVHHQHHATEDATCDTSCKVCRRVPDVEKKTKWVYSQKPLDYCVPSILPPCFHSSECNCGKVRTKCLLVKKAVVTECPTTKCIVEGGCATAPPIASAAPAPAPAPAPASAPAPAPFPAAAPSSSREPMPLPRQ